MTKAGSSDLERPIAIRPTSETVMYPYYAKVEKKHFPFLLRLSWQRAGRLPRAHDSTLSPIIHPLGRGHTHGRGLQRRESASTAYHAGQVLCVPQTWLSLQSAVSSAAATQQHPCTWFCMTGLNSDRGLPTRSGSGATETCLCG